VLTVAKLRFIREQLRVNILSNMEYRVSFITQLVFMFVNDIMLLFFWWVLFQRFDSVAGWQQQDVFLLYAVSAGTYGVAYTIFGNTGRLSSIIAEGQLDYYLALPKDVWLNVLISRSLASTIGDFAFGVVLCLAVFGLSAKVLAAVLFMGIAAVILVSAVTMVHSLTFYLGNAEQIAGVFSEALLSFSLYPISLFSLTLRVILYTAIPAAFVSFVPVTLVKEFSLPLFLAFVAVAVGGVFLSRRVFYAGLKRYESGNLVAPRM
jgi:ABC-2 type transport system permease protein